MLFHSYQLGNLYFYLDWNFIHEAELMLVLTMLVKSSYCNNTAGCTHVLGVHLDESASKIDVSQNDCSLIVHAGCYADVVIPGSSVD